MSMEQIATELKDAYSYIVAPKAMLDTPVEMSKLLKDDGLNYYTINDICLALGKQFELTEVIDDRFVAFRWSLNMNGVEGELVTYLKTKSLVDMRDDGIIDTLNYEVEEINFDTLNGNEFGIFGMNEFRKVPKVL